MVAESPIPGDQVYVAPPLAVRGVDEPTQIATLEPALTVGRELTLTVTVALLIQPIAVIVPVTVYVVVAMGLAVTVPPVVADSPAPGDHAYVLPPVAVSVVEDPAQMVTLDPPLTVGRGLTETITMALLLQTVAVNVPVTV